MNKLKIISLVTLMVCVFFFSACSENAIISPEEPTTESSVATVPDDEKTALDTSPDLPAGDENAATPTRDMIPEHYKWNLETVYKDNGALMSDLNFVESAIIELGQMKLVFTSSYDHFIKVLELYQAAMRKSEKLYVYATLQTHTDSANTDFSDLEEKIAQLNTDFSQSTAYIWPMVVALDENTLKDYMTQKESQEYAPFIRDILKDKDHILSESEEALLAQAEILFEIPESIYESYNYLTDLSEYIPEPDWDKFWSGTRQDKKTALELYYAKSSAGINLLSEIYESEIKKNTFFAKARNYDSALESALNTDGVTLEEYENFFTITHDNLDILHKWVNMKKDLLGLKDQLHIYDQYTSLIENPYAFIDYDQSIEIIYKALAPLGPKYQVALEKGFNSRWADVYTSKGKYEGGYQWGTYDTDPFVLLNFYGVMTDVSTVAHEMGHALNFKYTNEAQNYFSSTVPIFNAEIASTTNEVLVFEYLIKNAESIEEKQRALLDYILLIENTIFTQMIYADFEKRVYEAYDANEPLDADFFDQTMANVLQSYYGKNYYVDEIAKHQWAEIPHFYNSFYVYKYATGLSAGLTFADKIINGNKNDVNKYLDFLASGSSEPPLTLLKKAGVDFTCGEPLQRAFDKFDTLIDAFYDTFK